VNLENRAAALAAVVAAGVAAVISLPATAGADPFANLTGRWVGDAVMTPVSGAASKFKCVVTYMARKGGPGLQQNLRCEDGNNFKLHAATEISVEGGKVTGIWKDKINEIDGTVAGNVTADGFVVQLAGRFFEAQMAVAGSACDQSVKVMPAKSELFRELAATLKKC
jgi:hypothetical protein